MGTLANIQEALKAPKNKNNSFGKYRYRNVEDICEALKPLLVKYDADLVMTDSIEQVGDRYYLVATAALKADGKEYSAKGYAREGESKTGMDVAQLTGACSSYARKYALCALFLIDGSEDFDSMDNRTEDPQKSETKATAPTAAPAAEKPAGGTEKAYLQAMKACAQKNMQAYKDVLGKYGYESAREVPEDRRTEVYSRVFKAVNNEVTNV